MKFLYSIVLVCFLAQARSLSVPNPTEDNNNVLDGLVTNPAGLFQLPANVLIALPEKAVIQGMNFYCSALRDLGIPPLFTPSMNEMSLRLYNGCKETRFNLDKVEDILVSPDFDVTKPTVIFVTGWISSSEQDYVWDMANAYRCRRGYNFLAYNTVNTLHTLYTWSAFNTLEVGKRLATALVTLNKKVPAKNIHLIGHSLGAHIVGYAGRFFAHETGSILSRITGLDPAFPCFDQADELYGLQRGDAKFVDILHTNPGIFGMSNPMGDVDMYAQGLDANKPGCYYLGCSHFRAFKYYTESAYPDNEHNFMGKSCTSLENIDNGFCNGLSYPMGYQVPHNLTGNYFFRVNPSPPFGQNNGGRPAIPIQCVQKCY